MRPGIIATLFFITCSPAHAQDAPSKSPVARLGEIHIDVDSRLDAGWAFRDFASRGVATETRIEGVALNRGTSRFRISRWYGYDREGVKIDEGPLGYQDYPRGEPTRFEIHLGDNWKHIKRIKIAAY